MAANAVPARTEHGIEPGAQGSRPAASPGLWRAGRLTGAILRSWELADMEALLR